MNYYRHHVFFCLNQRDGGENCCNNHGAAALHAYAKKRIKELKLNGRGMVRMNSAGCLDRCDEGPVIVVYLVHVRERGRHRRNHRQPCSRGQPRRTPAHLT